jgi:hypothetical protein
VQKKRINDVTDDAQARLSDGSSSAVRQGRDTTYAPLLRIAAPVKAENVASLQRQ